MAIRIGEFNFDPVDRRQELVWQPARQLDDRFPAPRVRKPLFTRLVKRCTSWLPRLCGVSDDWLTASEDQVFIDEVRSAMRKTNGFATHLPGELPPTCVGAAILRERASGTELSSARSVLEALVERREAGSLEEDEFRITVGKLQLQRCLETVEDGVTLDTEEDTPCSARFAAAMVLTLRNRHGPLAPTEANVQLITKEYLRITRLNYVRDTVITDHLPFVRKIFFEQTAVEQRLAARRRLPRWLLATLDDIPSTSASTVI